MKVVLLLTTLLSGGAAFAQDARNGESAQMADGEILVTARKRTETAFNVPVVLQAVGAEEMQRRSIVNVDGIARITPLVIIGDNASSAQGAPIAIRGFSGADLNPFADQPASFNIDGIQVARSTVQRLSSMDIEQVEVLKGPQTLFFGKNSPAGVISIRTADPTDTFQSKFSSG
jgi:iron complex outermembrane receptor protein